MASDYDLAAFADRAESYGEGRQGRWRARVAARTADVALAAVPVPLRVLDVGCGTGMLLRELTERLPNVLEMTGVDPSDDMLRVARYESPDRIRFLRSGAEQLPFANGHFDLVVSTLSFHHWHAQPAGLFEVARVLAPEGSFVLVDMSARWIRRRGPLAEVRNPGEIVGSLRHAGLQVERTETVKRRVGLPFVRAFIAAK